MQDFAVYWSSPLSSLFFFLKVYLAMMAPEHKHPRNAHFFVILFLWINANFVSKGGWTLGQ